jgi:outer membrane protein insertion porin family
MRIVFAVILIFLLVLPGFAQQSDEWYQGKPIRRIVFEGLSNVQISELEGITAPYINRIFSDEVYWDLLGRLYALEYFDSLTPGAVMADPMGNEVIIRFTVVERPTVSRINFTGNNGVRRNELLETITLKVDDVVTQVKLRMDEQAIVNKYLEKGYPDAKVRSELSPGSNNTNVVIFHIDEGEKIAIESFYFEGNSVFSARTLQRQLSLKPKGIIVDGAFQESKLIADTQTLAQYYHDRGFIDAQVIDVVREVRKDDRGNNLMSITFRIYEGNLYTFGGINFEGNLIFTKTQLSNLIQSKVGDTVNARRVEADINRVIELYLENGYIFNRIDPVAMRDTERGVISYNVIIVERGRAHIENIILRGNIKTKDYVILREIPLETGDVFSRTKILDGLRNLYNSQFFSNVSVEMPPGSNDALMDLVISVEEQSTINLQIGFAFSGSADPDTFPASLNVKWDDRNFLGLGNLVGAELVVSPDTQTLTANYTQSWMFGLPFSGSFDFTFQHMNRKAALQNFAPYFYGDEPYAFPNGFGTFQEYEDAFRVPPDEYLMPYDQWRLSLGLSSGYRWVTQYGNLGFGGGFRIGLVRNTYDNTRYRPFDPILREENNNWTPALSIWTSVSLDQRDIYYDPSSGYYGIQRLGYYGILPFEKEHYIRTDTKAEWFYTLFDFPVGETWNFKAVFGIHSGLSFILPQPFSDNARVEEANQLAVDGMFNGRGWTTEYRRKGFALWENWAEVRIPLVPGVIAWDFFFDAAGIKRTPLALFTEFGDDDGTLAGVNTFFMRFSLGGGFRFSIPQFPFRFSAAKRFLIRDGKTEWFSGPMGGFDFVVSFALSTY